MSEPYRPKCNHLNQFLLNFVKMICKIGGLIIGAYFFSIFLRGPWIMRKNSTNKISWLLMIACAVSMHFAFAQQKSDTVLFPRPKTKSPYLKNSLHLSLPPLKPAATSNQKFSVSNDKLLEDVQVFPNPITDQVSVK